MKEKTAKIVVVSILVIYMMVGTLLMIILPDTNEWWMVLLKFLLFPAVIMGMVAATGIFIGLSALFCGAIAGLFEWLFSPCEDKPVRHPHENQLHGTEPEGTNWIFEEDNE